MLTHTKPPHIMATQSQASQASNGQNTSTAGRPDTTQASQADQPASAPPHENAEVITRVDTSSFGTGGGGSDEARSVIFRGERQPLDYEEEPETGCTCSGLCKGCSCSVS